MVNMDINSNSAVLCHSRRVEDLDGILMQDEDIIETVDQLVKEINDNLAVSFESVETHREFKAAKDGWEFTTIVALGSHCADAIKKKRMDAFIQHEDIDKVNSLEIILFDYIVDLIEQTT